MNIGPKTRTYTIEPLQVPVPAVRDDKEKETEPQRPRHERGQQAPTAPRR